MVLFVVTLPIVVLVGTYLYMVSSSAVRRRQSELDELQFEERLADERKKGIR